MLSILFGGENGTSSLPPRSAAYSQLKAKDVTEAYTRNTPWKPLPRSPPLQDRTAGCCSSELSGLSRRPKAEISDPARETRTAKGKRQNQGSKDLYILVPSIFYFLFLSPHFHLSTPFANHERINSLNQSGYRALPGWNPLHLGERQNTLEGG